MYTAEIVSDEIARRNGIHSTGMDEKLRGIVLVFIYSFAYAQFQCTLAAKCE